eukprot:2559907-Lingulodinium_polyedra.AAC.1
MPAPRRSMRKAPVDGDISLDAADIADGRVLEYPSVATVVLVAILARLTFRSRAKGGCRDAAARDACCVLLQAFINRAGLT